MFLHRKVLKLGFATNNFNFSSNPWEYFFIYLFKNSTQYKQYKIEDTIRAVEF